MVLINVDEVNIFKHRLYISTVEHARTLILGKYVLQRSIKILLSDFVKHNMKQ